MKAALHSSIFYATNFSKPEIQAPNSYSTSSVEPEFSSTLCVASLTLQRTHLETDPLEPTIRQSFNHKYPIHFTATNYANR